MKIIGILSGSKITGSMFHRIIYPLSALQDAYDDVSVKLTASVSLLSDEELREADIVLIHSTSPDNEEVRRLVRLGVNVVLDLDDYWVLSTKHELYSQWRERGETKRIIDLFSLRINYTVTTEALKEKVMNLAYNKNVCALPNGMIDDPEYRNPIKKDGVNFGWMGATNHITDLMLIQHLKTGYGFDVCIPAAYKEVFRDRFNYFNALPVPDYLNLYNTFDILLVPLDDNEFNKYKSELKLVEAGFYKKPVIISDVQPYSDYLRDGDNCLVVKKHRHWAKYCKMLAENPELRGVLGENLHKDMQEHFDLRKITKKRYDYFKKIIENV